MIITPIFTILFKQYQIKDEAIDKILQIPQYLQFCLNEVKEGKYKEILSLEPQYLQFCLNEEKI